MASLLVLAITASMVTAALYRDASRQRAGAEGLLQFLGWQVPVRKALRSMHAPHHIDTQLPLVDCGLSCVVCTGIRRYPPWVQIGYYMANTPGGPRTLDALRQYVPKGTSFGVKSQLGALLGSVSV